MTIKLSPAKYRLMHRQAISVYEHNVLVENGDKYTINGQATDKAILSNRIITGL
ncbi:MAG: hypothetical protein IPL23_23540 [Saprospiraceae bacterium]|nr:hypothetical protein [Saprospiraceae bacterium]